jgi:hypothetical protein
VSTCRRGVTICHGHVKTCHEHVTNMSQKCHIVSRMCHEHVTKMSHHVVASPPAVSLGRSAVAPPPMLVHGFTAARRPHAERAAPTALYGGAPAARSRKPGPSRHVTACHIMSQTCHKRVTNMLHHVTNMSRTCHEHVTSCHGRVTLCHTVSTLTTVAEVVVCQVVVVRTHERHEHTFHVQDHEHLELVAGVNDERSHTVQCSPTPREHLSQQLLTCMNTSLSSCSHCTDTGTPTPLCMSPYRPLP